MSARDPIPETQPRKVKTWAQREEEARNRVAREKPDYSHVPPSQWKMHDRLENWARWARGRPGQDCTPMFRLHRTDSWQDREYGALTVVPVDKDDAVKIAKAVAALPDKHRRAVQWQYLQNARSATAKARELGLSHQGLADMVQAGRQMLINRRA